MQTFVTWAYGREIEYKRAILAITSFFAWYEQFEGHVRCLFFTDDPAYFADVLAGLPVEYVHLSPEYLAQMKGPKNFVFRIKILIIDHAFKKYPNDNLLYVDSDTFLVKNPQSLLDRYAPGTSYMHLREYRLNNKKAGYVARDFLPVLAGSTFRTSQGPETFDPGLYSWCAGAMGFHAQDAALIPDVLDLSDQFLEASGVVHSEQYAFSIVAQTRTTVRPCDDYIYHYSAQKEALTPFFEELAIELKQTSGLEARLQRVRETTRAVLEYLASAPAEAAYLPVRDVRRRVVQNPLDIHSLRDMLYIARTNAKIWLKSR